jgi:hypothetical protein
MFRYARRVSQEKRKIGRPATGRDPNRSIRMSDERWEALDKKSKQAGSDRAKVVNDLAAWYVREDGAELPERPD